MGLHGDEEDMSALGMAPDCMRPSTSCSISPTHSPTQDDKPIDHLMTSDASGISYEKEINLLMKQISANSIDNYSRTLFPVGYGIFNLIYWFYYLYMDKNW